jgi:hypothetical protein
MSVLARIQGQKAILREGKWWSAHRDIERMLNDATEEWIEHTGGPALDDPDPERTVAQTILSQLGGHISLKVAARDPEARRLYLSRRQMKLFAPWPG